MFSTAFARAGPPRRRDGIRCRGGRVEAEPGSKTNNNNNHNNSNTAMMMCCKMENENG